MSNSLAKIKEKTLPIFKKYGINQAAVFGSYAAGKETPSSDVDFLVHIEKKMNLVQFIQLKEELEKTLRKNVDVVSDDAIVSQFEPYIRQNLVSIL